MSSFQPKPDLEESINVTEAHGRAELEAAAAAREKRIPANGIEPVTLWVLAACGIVLVIAGGILGLGGKLFAYDATIRPDYVRKAAPGTKNTGPVAIEALAAYMKRGANVYSGKCNGCHGGTAKGDGANYPSLVGSEWVLGDTERFAMIILNGLHGPISTGKTYGGSSGMPPQGITDPADLAAVMTYVRNHFGNTKGDVVTKEMAAAAIEISNARPKPGQVTGAELSADHLKALPGAALDPKTLVDPKTLEPVVAK